jgi:predicted ATPase
VQTTLGPALIATKGYAAPEVLQTYARARELCQQVGEVPQLFQVLLGLRGFYQVGGELQTALELAQQCLSMAQRVQDPVLLAQAHTALGHTLYYLGEFVPSRAHLEQGITLYETQQYRSLAWRSGAFPGVMCLSTLAWASWYHGYPDQALQRIRDGLTLAHELSHPQSLEHALSSAAIVHQLRREGNAARERAEAAIDVSTEQGFRFRMAWGTILRGWALAELGQQREGIVQMRQGLADYRSTGAEVSRPWFLALLAETYGKMGQAEEGLAVLAEALAAVPHTDQRYYQAELHRLKGELLLARSTEDHTAAESCFQRALDVGRRQQAKSLELRAAMSLSRLWQQQGKRVEAHALLAPIYSWFTEGFDTADLQEAKALLEVLS